MSSFRKGTRPGYLDYLRSQFGWHHFKPYWLPAVAVACYIQWRAGGFVRLALVVLLASPAAVLFATWWDWRKLGRLDD